MPEPTQRCAIRYFGDYVLLGEIARGGMGVVFRALQTSLDREVAIKMIDAGKLASEAAVRRFKNEAEAMARLDHPNIVSIYEIGEHEGHHYFAMKLVDGLNLAEHTGGKPLEPRRAAELLLTVTRAVQYAHDRGVLHRDLKPSNILLDERGKPHVTDFGIAKLVERGADLTGSIAMLGTPEYMAPEQASGKARQVGTAADTYSLGAVLYYLLTGQPPFRGETPLETLDHVLNQQPVSLRSLNPSVDRDLETICFKCLEKDSPQRYPTAEALALDLDNWISGQPITARPAASWERGLKWLVRHPAVSAAAAVALVLFVAGLPWFMKSLIGRSPRNEQNDPATLASSSNVAAIQARHDPATNAVALVAQPTNPSTTTAFVARPLPPLKSPTLPVALVTKPTFKGYIKSTPSGQPREILERKPDGSEVVQYLSPTGRLQREVIRKRDGTQTTATFDPSGKLKQEEALAADDTEATTTVQYDRDGNERIRDSIKTDARGIEVSRSLAVRPIALVKNTSVASNAPIVRQYVRGRFGFMHRPAHAPDSPEFAMWLDSPAGTTNSPAFRFSWRWDGGWHALYQRYWTPYDVYPGLSAWATDWLIASYAADRYAASASSVQAREEARLAREDAAKAGLAAQQAKDPAEKAEARTAQVEAEARAAKAEARAIAAEREKGEATGAAQTFKGTPINSETKAALKTQIETAVTERKRLAEKLAKDPKTPLADVSKALADTNRLFLVSKAVSVTLAASGNPAGTLKEGALLKLEPGQESLLKNATERTFATLRVLTSMGEEGEAVAGTLVSLSLRELQEFESEFLAKLDLGLAEAHANKDLMSRGAL